VVPDAAFVLKPTELEFPGGEYSTPGRTSKGNRYIRKPLVEVAWAGNNGEISLDETEFYFVSFGEETIVAFPARTH